MKEAGKPVHSHESYFHLQKYLGFLLVLCNYHKKRYRAVLRDLQQLLHVDVKERSKRILNCLGVPGFYNVGADTSVDPDSAVAQFESAVVNDEVVFSLWWDNNDQDSYCYAPVDSTTGSRHITVLSAFSVPVSDPHYGRFAKPLLFNVDNPPHPPTVLNVAGVKALCQNWNKVCTFDGKSHAPQFWFGWVKWSEVKGLNIKSGDSWDITVDVLPTSTKDRHIPIKPSELWVPLDVVDERTNTLGGRKKALEWLEQYAQLQYSKGQCIVVVLDYDTWWNVLSHRYDYRNYGFGLLNVCCILDPFHILMKTTISFKQYLFPILANLSGAIFVGGETPLAFGRLKQLQWLLSVMSLAYNNCDVCFADLDWGSTRPHPLLFEWCQYLSSIFDFLLPCIWGGWWCYREGRPRDLWKLLGCLLPFLQYSNRNNYVIGVFFSVGAIQGNLGGVREWLTEGMFRLGAAETGELGFKFLTSRLRRYNKLDMKLVRTNLFALRPHWDAQVRWGKILGKEHKFKPHRTRIAHDCRWVQNLSLWIDSVHTEMTENNNLLRVDFPRRGGCLQQELPTMILEAVKTRLKTLSKSSQSETMPHGVVVGVEELWRVGQQEEHWYDNQKLKQADLKWIEWFENRYGDCDTSEFKPRPPVYKYKASKAADLWVTPDEWVEQYQSFSLENTPVKEAAELLLSAKKRPRADSTGESDDEDLPLAQVARKLMNYL